MTERRMEVVRRVQDLRTVVAGWRQRRETVALVPTMGALHEGHLSLMRLARERSDRVIATLFVNPRQFDRPEDLAAYPRTEETDRKLLEPIGVDLLFAPPLQEMYPPGYATTVSVAGLGDGLCGAKRPGHFDGVATVVSKLLLQSLPDVAIFGEKDYQQLQIIRRMTADLNIPVTILGGPIVRAADGLALSSRNAYLTAAERAAAPAMYRAISAAAARLVEGLEAAPVLAEASRAIVAAGYRSVDYIELCAADDLAPLARADRPSRVFAAAWLGKARLIDNVPVAQPVRS